MIRRERESQGSERPTVAWLAYRRVRQVGIRLDLVLLSPCACDSNGPMPPMMQPLAADLSADGSSRIIWKRVSPFTTPGADHWARCRGSWARFPAPGTRLRFTGWMFPEDR